MIGWLNGHRAGGGGENGCICGDVPLDSDRQKGPIR